MHIYYYIIYILYLHVADEEFDELCFDFGIELDEVVSECLKHVLVCVFLGPVYVVS